MLANRVFRVAGHVQNLDRRIALHQVARQLTAIYARHNHVGEQQADIHCMLFRHGQSGARIRGNEHRVTTGSENGTRELAHLAVIFHQEDGLGSTNSRSREGLCDCGGLIGLGGLRQIDFECSPVAHFAVNPNVAAALFHDAVDG